MEWGVECAPLKESRKEQINTCVCTSTWEHVVWALKLTVRCTATRNESSILYSELVLVPFHIFVFFHIAVFPVDHKFMKMPLCNNLYLCMIADWDNYSGCCTWRSVASHSHLVSCRSIGVRSACFGGRWRFRFPSLHLKGLSCLLFIIIEALSNFIFR